MAEVSAMIRARIDPELKSDAEQIFKELGLTATDAIRIYYQQVRIHRGIPFELKLPNAASQEAMEDARTRRNLERFESAEDALKSLGI